ncbi:uncharacterized protein LOC122335316 [Puntigrus tetrazona]|uniref:uncharacterized protein LOC122335316 n=1 Tax=Puntigrus tetrazona TaxID=1606681 RepID=UPI001C89764A|nr:uncharacterized protein LOC122335316 [Puntigrus tetrazona]
MFVVTPLLIILLTSACSKGEINLRAVGGQRIKCHEKTVLQCDVISSVPLKVDKVYWKKQDEIDFECDAKSSNFPPGFECNYTGEALTLSILNTTPANTGTYFCCITTDSGHGKDNIDLFIGQCSGQFSSQINGSNQIQCSYNRVYPEAVINWFHYDKNLTSNSTSTSLRNSDGTFNITSVLNFQYEQNKFNCSLWSLNRIRYDDHEVEVTETVDSRSVSGIGTQHCLSWTLILLSLMFTLSLYNLHITSLDDKTKDLVEFHKWNLPDKPTT